MYLTKTSRQISEINHLLYHFYFGSKLMICEFFKIIIIIKEGGGGGGGGEEKCI